MIPKTLTTCAHGAQADKNLQVHSKTYIKD